MKERPILFSAPMVRAILAGIKTQTRRIVKPQQPREANSGDFPYEFELTERNGDVTLYTVEQFVERCPYGAPGDRLWVRETWNYADWTEDGYPFVAYRADDATRLCEQIPSDWSERLSSTWEALSEPENFAVDGRAADRRWRPASTCPRWASRISLEVTGVRVERVQSISKEDAIAEGARHLPDLPPSKLFPNSANQARWSMEDPEDCGHCLGSPQSAFGNLWIKINGAESWASNPWVWVVEFKAVTP